MATVKGAFVYAESHSNWHLNKHRKAEDEWKERLKESTRCTRVGGGDFLVSSKDIFWGRQREGEWERKKEGEKRELQASDLLFHQKALAYCQGVGLFSNRVTFSATAVSGEP